MISLCHKAGHLRHGEFQVSAAAKGSRIKLMIIAADASTNTRERAMHLVKGQAVNIMEYADKKKLGRMIGKDDRSLIAVCNTGFADKIWSLYQGGTVDGKNESE